MIYHYSINPRDYKLIKKLENQLVISIINTSFLVHGYPAQVHAPAPAWGLWALAVERRWSACGQP